MAIGTFFTQYLNRASQSSIPQRHLPMFNTAITSLGGSIASSTVLTQRKKELMKWYEVKSGLLVGLVNKVATKINEKVYFEPINNKDGRNRILKSQKFYDDNRLREMFFSLLVDAIVTGECYLVKRDISSNTVNKMLSEALIKKGLPDNQFTRNMLYKANFPDDNDPTTKKLLYLPSSTVENIYDQYEVIRYVQRVAMREESYTIDEVMHYKLFDVNGRVTGFTPLNTLLSQLELDYFMWNNMLGVAKNSGQPDKLYTAEDVDVNSPAFKRIEAELQKYHGPTINRHGSLLLAGKVTVQELQQLESMQFENMGIYVASLVALQWDVPRSSIPFMSKEANTKEDTGGNSERDFYGRIEYAQDLFSDYLNRMLWTPLFGTRMRFEKKYKHDQMVEVQTQQLRLNNLTFMNNELGRVKKVLKPDYVIRYINGINEQVEEEDIEEKPEEEMMDNSQMRQGMMSNNVASSNSDKNNVSNRKRDEQENVAKNTGKPTGYGKEEKIIPDFSSYPYNLS